MHKSNTANFEFYLVTGKTVDKLVHYAVKEYLVESQARSQCALIGCAGKHGLDYLAEWIQRRRDNLLQLAVT